MINYWSRNGTLWGERRGERGGVGQGGDLFAKVQTVYAFLSTNLCMFFGKGFSENFTMGQLECKLCLYKVGKYTAIP